MSSISSEQFKIKLQKFPDLEYMDYFCFKTNVPHFHFELNIADSLFIHSLFLCLDDFHT